MGHSADHRPAPTLEECRADETLVSNAEIIGAVIGIAPELAHHMTEEAWIFLEGLANKPEISGYTILGLTSGIDLSQMAETASEEDELRLAVLQGNALARMTAIAARTGLPLVLKLLNSRNKHVEPFTWALGVLRQVPGWDSQHKVVISQYWGTANQANMWLREQPRTWFGISHEFVNLAARDHENSAWMQDIPLGFLVPESVTPLGSQRGQKYNDPSEVVELVNAMGELTGEDEHHIFQEFARSVVSAYDLDLDRPDILDRTGTAESRVFRPSREEFLRRVQAAREGPVAVPDAIRRVAIPAAPRSRRGAATAPPPPAVGVANAAAAQLAQAAEGRAANAAQGPIQPDVPYVQALPPLAQATLFDVSDQANHGWELNRMCPDHVRGPGNQRRRTHPQVAEIVGRRYGALTSFPNDVGMRDRAVRVGQRYIHSIHHMLVVIVAGRILRQERHRARTLVFLEHAMNCDDPRNLVHITTMFLVEVRERMRTWHQEAIRKGENVQAPDLTFYRFSQPDTIYMIQYWICRCETGNEYFCENSHGPVTWLTAGYDACTDPDVRQSFEQCVRDYFPTAVNLVRHREYDQHVLERVNTPNRWPPMPVTFSVDPTKCLWSRTVVFMDEWAVHHLSGGLRIDTTCIELPSDPDEAWKVMRSYFFAHTVERIVFFYGDNSLWDNHTDGTVQFMEETAVHMSQNFGRARVYFVCAPYVRERHAEWDYVVRLYMLENDHQLRDLAMLVSYPLDRRLNVYFDANPGASWPQVARLEQDSQGRLSERGIAERKTYMVLTHGLDLWSELTQEELTQDEILQIALARVHETPRHFGRPTVRIPNFEELIKKKKKEAPPSQKQASEQTPSGSKRPAGQRKFGGRPTFETKRGKGSGLNRSQGWRGSQQSVRSDHSSVSSINKSSRFQGRKAAPLNVVPEPVRSIDKRPLAERIQDPGFQELLRTVLDNPSMLAFQPQPAVSRTAPHPQPVATAAAATAPATSRRQHSQRDRAPVLWPSEQRKGTHPAPADDYVEEDDMVVRDFNAGLALGGPVLEHVDPAEPTDTVNTVKSAAENSANTGTSNEDASKTSKTGSDSSSAATSSAPSSTTATTSADSAGSSATTSSAPSTSTSTSTSTVTSSGTTAPSTTSRTSRPRSSPSSANLPRDPFNPKRKRGGRK